MSTWTDKTKVNSIFSTDELISSSFSNIASDIFEQYNFDTQGVNFDQIPYLFDRTDTNINSSFTNRSKLTTSFSKRSDINSPFSTRSYPIDTWTFDDPDIPFDEITVNFDIRTIRNDESISTSWGVRTQTSDSGYTRRLNIVERWMFDDDDVTFDQIGYTFDASILGISTTLTNSSRINSSWTKSTGTTTNLSKRPKITTTWQ
jgi:hypothetical protein